MKLMIKHLRLLAVAVMLLTIAGCSGEQDRHKFKDLDRPIPATK